MVRATGRLAWHRVAKARFKAGSERNTRATSHWHISYARFGIRCAPARMQPAYAFSVQPHGTLCRRMPLPSTCAPGGTAPSSCSLRSSTAQLHCKASLIDFEIFDMHEVWSNAFGAVSKQGTMRGNAIGASSLPAAKLISSCNITTRSLVVCTSLNTHQRAADVVCDNTMPSQI
jgi:hypothetical protein